eukprot:scaffold1323_cov255-Pinguiococcus_pyrenoidosus.AAC.9
MRVPRFLTGRITHVELSGVNARQAVLLSLPRQRPNRRCRIRLPHGGVESEAELHGAPVLELQERGH